MTCERHSTHTFKYLGHVCVTRFIPGTKFTKLCKCSHRRKHKTQKFTQMNPYRTGQSLKLEPLKQKGGNMGTQDTDGGWKDCVLRRINLLFQREFAWKVNKFFPTPALEKQWTVVAAGAVEKDAAVNLCVSLLSVHRSYGVYWHNPMGCFKDGTTGAKRENVERICR